MEEEYCVCGFIEDVSSQLIVISALIAKEKRYLWCQRDKFFLHGARFEGKLDDILEDFMDIDLIVKNDGSGDYLVLAAWIGDRPEIVEVADKLLKNVYSQKGYLSITDGTLVVVSWEDGRIALVRKENIYLDGYQLEAEVEAFLGQCVLYDAMPLKRRDSSGALFTATCVWLGDIEPKVIDRFQLRPVGDPQVIKTEKPDYVEESSARKIITVDVQSESDDDIEIIEVIEKQNTAPVRPLSRKKKTSVSGIRYGIGTVCVIPNEKVALVDGCVDDAEVRAFLLRDSLGQDCSDIRNVFSVGDRLCMLLKSYDLFCRGDLWFVLVASKVNSNPKELAEKLLPYKNSVKTGILEQVLQDLKPEEFVENGNLLLPIGESTPRKSMGTVRQPASSMLETENLPLEVREPTPAVSMETGNPSLEVREPTPDVSMETGNPTLEVREPTPAVSLETETPTLEVREPTPAVSMETETPTLEVREPTPAVSMETGNPTLELREPTPAVSMETETPSLEVREPTPTVSMETGNPTLADGEPVPAATRETGVEPSPPLKIENVEPLDEEPVPSNSDELEIPIKSEIDEVSFVAKFSPTVTSLKPMTIKPLMKNPAKTEIILNGSGILERVGTFFVANMTLIPNRVLIHPSAFYINGIPYFSQRLSTEVGREVSFDAMELRKGIHSSGATHRALLSWQGKKPTPQTVIRKARLTSTTNLPIRPNVVYAGFVIEVPLLDCCVVKFGAVPVLIPAKSLLVDPWTKDTSPIVISDYLKFGDHVAVTCTVEDNCIVAEVCGTLLSSDSLFGAVGTFDKKTLSLPKTNINVCEDEAERNLVAQLRCVPLYLEENKAYKGVIVDFPYRNYAIAAVGEIRVLVHVNNVVVVYEKSKDNDNIGAHLNIGSIVLIWVKRKQGKSHYSAKEVRLVCENSLKNKVTLKNYRGSIERVVTCKQQVIKLLCERGEHKIQSAFHLCRLSDRDSGGPAIVNKVERKIKCHEPVRVNMAVNKDFEMLHSVWLR